MFTKTVKTGALLSLSTLLMMGCGLKQEEQSSDQVMSVMATDLKTVGDEYLPEGLTDDGTAPAAKTGAPLSSKITAQTAGEDICAGVNFIECQPRLIRAYVTFGRDAVYLTQKIVQDVAKNLAGAANNSSGVIKLQDQNLTVEYAKRTTLDFDFLVTQGTTPVGRVSASPSLYTIQFDIGVLEKDKPGSRGGKIDIQVKYTDRSHWTSQVTVTDLLCNTAKPDDPETGRIAVKRNGEIWTGQSMFYNGIAGAVNQTKSCSLAATDSTGMVVYTDFVANRIAAKAAMYMMKRNETSTTAINTYGLNSLCTNYPTLCQDMATSLGTTTAAVEAVFGQLQNPYCVVRGSKVVTFNSTCSSLSKAVSDEPFSANASWVTPYDFYRMSIAIPTHF